MARDDTPAATGSLPAEPTVDPTNPTAVDQRALTAAMEEVQQLGERDPNAQQQLLDQLRRSKPELWPLVVEQFRSSLAYHEQLIARGTSDADNMSKDSMDSMGPSSELRPSAEVGQLVDPRSVRPDATTEQAFASATPAKMPAPFDPNAALTASKPAYAPRPIADDVEADPIQAHDRQQFDAVAPEQSAGIALASYSAAPQRHDQLEANDSAARDPQRRAAALDWRQHLALAVDDLSSRASDSPQSTAEVHQQVSLRMMELLAGNTEAALRPIPKISAAEQDYWSSQIYTLATFLDHHSQPDDTRRAAASVIHLDEAVGHLREMGSLSLRNLAFCKKVHDYGAYDPHLEPRFAPGQQVTLYVEVENYHSESTEEGYCTSLGSSYELLDNHGERVGNGEFPDVEDCCRSRRRDFHIQYGLVLPKGLPPGGYRLELAMNDRRSDKRGHASIAFEIK
jgi:hypothetical protein